MQSPTPVMENLELSSHLDDWSNSDSDKGEIFTSPEIVSYMLKLCELEEIAFEASTRILEPSCGGGEFVEAIAEIISQQIKNSKTKPRVEEVKRKVLSFDLIIENVEITQSKVISIFQLHYPPEEARSIALSWVRHGDFLLTEVDGNFSHIIGNPPYIRVENIPKPLLQEYRSRFSTMTDRADIYIGFFEKSLYLLNQHGKLCFICTDRWTKNRYGSRLRSLIDEKFNLDLYVDLYGTQPFQSKVMTYPAITLISRKITNNTVILHSSKSVHELAQQTLNAIKNGHSDNKNITVRKISASGTQPWLFGSIDELQLIQKLESNFPLIENVGCKVFIGAATGNNKIYFVDDNTEIEKDRLIPLVTSGDIRRGKSAVKGKFIINTYDENGVIELEHYPKLKSYLERHKPVLEKRHVAKKNPTQWFKTIDRVYPARARREKLLIPDIGSEFTVVYDGGVFHPNNSIYYICSETWDLHALKAVLISGIGRLFIETYSTKVANGHLRFQAQHLRRICVPDWNTLDQRSKNLLSRAGIEDDLPLARKIVSEIYKLTVKEKQIIGG